MYEEGDDCCNTSFETLCMMNKKKNMKRRFSDEQIKSLDTIFELDTKLEPRKKLQVARELGLQPRQVAIWFQNKRARWKSKQLERDYNILQANYNTLASQFDNLKKEKQSLVLQLKRLQDMMEKSGDHETKELATYSTDDQSDNNTYNEFEVKPCFSDDDSNIKAEYFGLDHDHDGEHDHLLSTVEMEPVDGSLTSTEDWDNLDSNALLEQPSTSYPWWDFWS